MFSRLQHGILGIVYYRIKETNVIVGQIIIFLHFLFTKKTLFQNAFFKLAFKFKLTFELFEIMKLSNKIYTQEEIYIYI